MRCGANITANRKNILIDTSPDLRCQLLRFGIQSVDAIFFTHWHWDHFGGIGELEYYIKLHRKKPVDVYAMPETMDSMEYTFPNMSELFDKHILKAGEEVCLPGVTITPYMANHGIETIGFLIEGSEKRIAYFPDTSGLSDETMDALLDIDVFICDSSFFGKNLFPDVHMSSDETITLGRVIGAGETYLTHHAVHYSDVKTVKGMKDELSGYNDIKLAYDGLKIEL